MTVCFRKTALCALAALFSLVHHAPATTRTELLDVMTALRFDRSEFGSAPPLPLWYPLNEFDRFALDKVYAARQNDPDALLALGLFASGDIRTMEQYYGCKERVDTFVERIEPLVKAKETVEAQGKTVFLEMCREFYGMNRKGELRGYSFDESRLSASFSTGEFNCVSSSMLYIILTRHFGLESYGVELPTHVFVKIDIPGGGEIEVETTSGQGYGTKHSQEFFNEQRSRWFEERGLEEATYEDYLNRRIHTPLAFVCHNMRNQHTSLKRMDIRDRHRLLEVRGYIMPESPSAAMSRLNVYLAEFSYLTNASETTDLVRFAATVSPEIARLVEIHGDDTAMADMMAAVKPMALHLTNTAAHEAVMCTDPAMLIRTQDRTEPVLRFTAQTLLATMMPCIGLLVDTGMVDSALGLLDTLGTLGTLDEWLRPHRYNLANRGARDAWDHDDYSEAVRLCSLAVRYAPDEEAREIASGNLEAAYCNLAGQHTGAKRYSKARAVLRECIEQLQSPDNCKQHLEQIERVVGAD
ncbi:MAG: hypothetical protein GF331_05135 [Chitinivibrionales bacterium]|nr:hypothetical protein [Chitinivibrionales bacterium]